MSNFDEIFHSRLANNGRLFLVMNSYKKIYRWLIIALWILSQATLCFADCVLPPILPPPMVELPCPHPAEALPKTLSLYEAILLALRFNPNVRTQQIQRVADKFALEVAHNNFNPQYTFNATATFLRNSKPQYTIVPQVNWLLPLGTQIAATTTISRLGSAGAGNATTVTLTQPLLRGFGETVTMAPLVQAEYQEANQRLTLKNIVMSTVTQVIQDYYALVQAYNNLTVDELALQNSITMLQQFRVRIQAGQAAPLEIAPQESQVASQKLQVTLDKNAIQQNYQTLMITLGLNPSCKLEIDKSISLDTFPIPSIPRAYVLALENNIAYQQAVFNLKSQELEVIQQRDAQRWQLNFIATKNFASDGASPSEANDQIQLTLNVPIHDLPLQQQLVNAEVQYQQTKVQLLATKRQLKSDVITSIESLNLQLEQIKQAQAAVVFAQQAFDVEVKKLYYGRSTVLNVTQLRNDLTEAKISLISQEISYINTLAQFEQNLGVTLERWQLQLFY